MKYLEAHASGTILCRRVIPRAKKNHIEGPLGETLKIRLQSPPVDGKANKALLTFLAGERGIATGKLQLLTGEKSRDKRVLIRGIGAEQVRESLER